MNRVDFRKAPTLGTVLMVEGQRYELVEIEPYRRQDGQPTLLLHWRTHCPDCAMAFIVKTGLRQKAINRRCPKHHKPRVPVALSRWVVKGRTRHG